MAELNERCNEFIALVLVSVANSEREICENPKKINVRSRRQVAQNPEYHKYVGAGTWVSGGRAVANIVCINSIPRYTTFHVRTSPGPGSNCLHERYSTVFLTERASTDGLAG